MGRVVIRANTGDLRRGMSFSVSMVVHGSLLAWVAFSGVPPRPQLSLYDQEIRPYENKIIWYKLADKLPEIEPATKSADPRPLRARVKANQVTVSGAQDDPKPETLIWTPETVPLPKPGPLPNLVAIAAPKLTRPFEPPKETPQPQAAPKLPEPPRVESRIEAAPLPVEAKLAKPTPRAFAPPPESRLAKQVALALPEAPEAKSMVVEAGALPFAPVGARPRGRDFVPPQERRAAAGPVKLPPPPEVGGKVVVEPAKLPRGFVAPPSRPVDRNAPAVTADAPAIDFGARTAAETTMAIVSLNPANTREAPAPPGSRPAGFSAGPEVRKDGSSGSNDGTALLNVPGLTVRGGAKDDQPTLVTHFSPTSKENLIAAARSVGGLRTEAAPARDPGPVRVADAPDPRLAGRVVYTIAIQMPNVTSYSGSWMVWFAEREPLPGAPHVDMRPPVPLRKVDPKYVAAAVAERVEGIIRLAAVIRKDGTVDSISMIRQLDRRLDQTAQEALAKWEFTPALRNGAPVDVDAVFEIPFRLAPKPGR